MEEKKFAFFGNEIVGTTVVSRLADEGYARTEEVSDAAVIVTYCTSQTSLEDVYFDERGIVQAAMPGTLLLDLSAATPGFARELHAVAIVSDLASVEAPLVVADVTAPDAFAERDNLMCLVAGEDKDVEQAHRLLDALVGVTHVTGGPGSAQLARAAYTLQVTAQIMAAIEADALYRAMQLSSSSLDAVYGRAGAMTPEAERILKAVSEGRFSGTYTIEMLMAELSATLMAADDVDLILPQAEACLHLLELLAVIGGVDKPPSALALVYGEETACAENGLDWARAEQAYSTEEDEDEHGLDDDGEYPAGFGAYSAN